jgi:hypothetical protein
MTMIVSDRRTQVAPPKQRTLEPSTLISIYSLEGVPRHITYADLCAVISSYHPKAPENASPNPTPNASSSESELESQPNKTLTTTIVKTSRKVFNTILLKDAPPKSVFRRWPYLTNPSHTFVFDRTILGKRTPNGAAWGASVFDFYTVEMLPDTWVVMTGSKLLAWAEGREEEMARAKDEIEWARREEDPCMIEPRALGKFLEQQEDYIRSREIGWGVPMPMDWELLSRIVGPEKVC